MLELWRENRRRRSPKSSTLPIPCCRRQIAFRSQVDSVEATLIMASMDNTDTSEATSPAQSPAKRPGFSLNKWMKPVRRVHMYLGLLLLPWVLLFGVSGFFFNHNTTTFGGPFKTVKELTAPEVAQSTSWKPSTVESMAAEVISGINERLDRQAYQLQPGSAEVMGGVVHETRVDDGVLWVRLDLEQGNATVLHRSEMGAEQHVPAFQDQEVRIASIDRDSMAKASTEILKASGLKAGTPVKLLPVGQPLLRFQAVDQEGQSWNAVYNMANGKLTGRATDDESGMSLFRSATRLHTTHVYPERMGSRWLWALMADAAGLSMVVWGITGLAMWWQIKRSRVMGVLAVASMLLFAAVVFTGTLKDHTFGRDPIARKIPTPEKVTER